MGTDNKNALDGCYPYMRRGAGIAVGSLFLRLPALSRVDVGKATVDDDFTMWLMFKPNSFDSAWVPLKKVNWYWKAQAAALNRKWSYSGNNPPNPAFTDAIDFPAWKTIVPTDKVCP